ncbi:MAG: hypothetical protein QOH12_1468 [Solirubrobacteraceae bacterium]|jgi:hypothetical protein|nr:hypothetical protein [Solirubrobacteraceae bacterium]
MLGVAGADPPAARAALGIQITINGAPSTFVSPDQVSQNADVEPGPGATFFLAGLSPRLLAELAGVAPAYTLQGMTISNIPPCNPSVGCFYGLPDPDPITATEVISGFQTSYGTGSAVFVRDPVLTGPFAGSVGVMYEQPGGKSYPTYDSILEDVADGPTLPLLVDIANSGIVLGVPAPAFDVCTPGVGQNVGFSLPSTGAVRLGQAQGAPADSNGLRYSWEFGDGTSPTALSASDAASHAFAATGTFDVRLTAVDAAGNAGVSPVAAQVSVGSTRGVAGPCGQVPGAGAPNGGHGGSPGSPSPGGGAHQTGGGAGPANTLSSGAAPGSVHAPTSAVAPRTTGAAAPARPRPAGPTSASGTSGSASGSGGGGRGGSGGGRHGGGGAGASGSGAGASGKQGASGTRARGARAGAGAGGGRSKPPQSVRPAGAPAAPGLSGVLIESLGSPLGALSRSASLNTLSLLQSVARRSTGGAGSGGLPAWLLGIMSLMALVVLGVVREAGVGLAGRRGAVRSGSGGIRPGVA